MPASNQTLSEVDGLTQLSFVIQQMLERRVTEHNLSLIQIRLLGVLRDREPTMTALATLLGLDKSSVSGLVDRAQRRGLVERIPAPDDRRASLVRLTDPGRAIATEVAGRFADDISALLSGLPRGERKTLSQLVSKLLTTLATAQGVDLFDTASSPNSP